MFNLEELFLKRKLSTTRPLPLHIFIVYRRSLVRKVQSIEITLGKILVVYALIQALAEGKNWKRKGRNSLHSVVNGRYKFLFLVLHLDLNIRLTESLPSYITIL